MTEIVIISNYYPPEKGAAANRIEQLALKLKHYGYDVTVICPLGNYPEGKLFDQYKGKFYAEETPSGIRVKRLWIYPSNSSNIALRMISVASFSMVLFFYLLFSKTPHKVIVQSPPLLLSFIATTVLKLKRKKIILNVSDLWPLAAIELDVLKAESFSHKFLKHLERQVYKNSTVIIGQSNEILNHIRSIENKEVHLYRNYPNHQNIAATPAFSNKIKVFYAGLLGVAQGVYELCENIQLPENIEFHIFGDGAEKFKILEYLHKYPQRNIFFHGMLNRSELLMQLPNYDIALVPLKTRIYGSVPSKIFEYGALGYPILYFGGGEGEDLVKENKLGWVVDVENFSMLNQTLTEISLLSSLQILKLKQSVFEQSKMFDLDQQITNLIQKGVF